jgi:hypothetical protein
MGDSIDLLQPYGYSFAGDDDEQALKEIFTTVFNELFGDQIRIFIAMACHIGEVQML